MDDVLPINLPPAVAGDALEYVFTVRDHDGNGVDITDMEVEFAIVKGGEDVISTEEGNAVVTITAPLEGQFTVKIDCDETEGLIGTHDFACRVTDDEGQCTTVARGWLQFTPSIL